MCSERLRAALCCILDLISRFYDKIVIGILQLVTND